VRRPSPAAWPRGIVTDEYSPACSAHAALATLKTVVPAAAEVAACLTRCRAASRPSGVHRRWPGVRTRAESCASRQALKRCRPAQVISMAGTLPQQYRSRAPGQREAYVVHDFEGPEPDVRTMLERIVFTKEVWTAAIGGRDVPSRDKRSIVALQARLAMVQPQFTAPGPTHPRSQRVGRCLRRRALHAAGQLHLRQRDCSHLEGLGDSAKRWSACCASSEFGMSGLAIRSNGSAWSRRGVDAGRSACA
jgi:hypothetical protein